MLNRNTDSNADVLTVMLSCPSNLYMLRALTVAATQPSLDSFMLSLILKRLSLIVKRDISHSRSCPSSINSTNCKHVDSDFRTTHRQCKLCIVA